MSIIISVFSFILAIISLSWNIYNEISKRKGSIKVTIDSLLFGKVKEGDIDLQDKAMGILGEVTNIGYSNRVIKNYMFTSLIKSYGLNYINGSNGSIYKTLQPGEVFPIQVDDMNVFIKHFDKRAMFINNFDYIRLEVFDTHGKVYKSKRMRLSYLYKLVNFPKEHRDYQKNK